MFWGLILEPNKRYSQTVEKSFHVSMASLNLTTADDNVVQVILYYEGTRYLLCNLKKSSTWQVPLDLNFQEGTTIAFVCHGHGQVHLTGYLIDSEDFNELEGEEEEEEEEEEGEEVKEEEDEEEAPTLVKKQSKRKSKDSLKTENKAKRLKQEAKEELSDEDVQLDGIDEENDSDESEEEGEESSNDIEDEDNEEEEEVKSPQKKKEDKKLVNGKEVKQKKNQAGNVRTQQNVQNEQKKKSVEGGVQIEEIKVGNGPFAKSGKFISVYYVGRLKNGKKFDATTQGEGFKFRLGKGEVIKGWDVGIIGMKVGGKRRITIPPAMAYGAKGSPPVIPGNSTLVFEVELRNVH